MVLGAYLSQGQSLSSQDLNLLTDFIEQLCDALDIMVTENDAGVDPTANWRRFLSRILIIGLADNYFIGKV